MLKKKIIINLMLLQSNKGVIRKVHFSLKKNELKNALIIPFIQNAKTYNV